LGEILVQLREIHDFFKFPVINYIEKRSSGWILSCKRISTIPNEENVLSLQGGNNYLSNVQNSS